MGKGSYLGGSTIVGPGNLYFRISPEDENTPRVIDPELQAIMAEHDQLRAKGIRPIDKENAEKAHRKSLKAGIRKLKKELERLKNGQKGE